MNPTLPPEAESLLAVAPEDFVQERKRVAGELRDAGRTEDAKEVSALRKPPTVVLAVNGAARERPKAAEAAAEAATRVAKAQVGGETDAYRQASLELERALADLAEVAVALLSTGKPAGDAMRRRAHDLLRAAVAGEGSRAALLRGALTEEIAFSGFEALTALPRRAATRKPASSPSAAKKRDERRARERELRRQLSAARKALRDASSEVEQARRSYEAAADRVEALEQAFAELEQG